MKQWKPLDRPREKLIQNGKTTLSDAELLSILIGTGNRKESAVDLARRILGSFDNSLTRIARAPVTELTKFEGIGKVKALIIVTALELGQRRNGELRVPKPRIVSSQSVYDLMQPVIGELNHEEFWILYLNGANRVEARIQLSKGGMTATLVDVRLVFKLAMQHARNILSDSAAGNVCQPVHRDLFHDREDRFDVNTRRRKESFGGRNPVYLRIACAIEHLANERIAIRMRPARCNANDHIAGAYGAAVDHLVAFDGTDRETGEVIVTGCVHVGHFGSFAAHQSNIIIFT